MDTSTRIRINLNQREVEWEGSETFIEKHQSIIDEFIDRIRTDSNLKVPISLERSHSSLAENKEVTSKTAMNNSNMNIPDSFGEFYMQFPKNAKISEKILIAGFFVQSKSEDGLFTPKEAADLLNEQNVRVTNANAFSKSLQETGRLYKQSGKFKVHEKGIEYIKQLHSQLS